MLSESSKSQIAFHTAAIARIVLEDKQSRIGECMVCGKPGKPKAPMGFHANTVSFNELGFGDVYLCKPHSAGLSRAVNSRLFGTWFESNKPDHEDVRLVFAEWLAKHLNEQSGEDE